MISIIPLLALRTLIVQEANTWGDSYKTPSPVSDAAAELSQWTLRLRCQGAQAPAVAGAFSRPDLCLKAWGEAQPAGTVAACRCLLGPRGAWRPAAGGGPCSPHRGSRGREDVPLAPPRHRLPALRRRHRAPPQRPGPRGPAVTWQAKSGEATWPRRRGKHRSSAAVPPVLPAPRGPCVPSPRRRPRVATRWRLGSARPAGSRWGARLGRWFQRAVVARSRLGRAGPGGADGR